MDYSLEVEGITSMEEIEKERMEKSAEEDFLWEEFEEYRKTRVHELEEEIVSRKDEIEELYNKIETVSKSSKSL